MPNYVANIVTFDGDEKRIKDMLLAVQNDEFGPGSISFNKIIPMPPELDIECGRSKTDPQVIRNIQMYGAPDWYDWRREHWNTKWDAGGYEEDKDYSQCDKLAFRTAWHEPAPVIQKLSEMYPDIEFTHQWAEEQMVVNCGTAKYKAGVQTEYEQVEGYDERMDFSVEVWYQYEHNGLPQEQEQTM